MAKTIGLFQLSQKKYTIIEGLPQEITDALGQLEDAFDMLLHGASNNGKSSFIAILLTALIKALECKCEYIAYEEAHGMTIQQTMIVRYNMFNVLGNVIQITDHYTFEELDKRMARKQSAKIWVIDSLQASGITSKQIAYLKRKYVTSKKKKILIIISWSEGKFPAGADAKAVEYYANIKSRVQDLIVYPKSRYGGGKPYVIHKETAIRRLGEKEFYKAIGEKPPTKPKKKTKELPPVEPEAETNNQVCEPDTQL